MSRSRLVNTVAAALGILSSSEELSIQRFIDRYFREDNHIFYSPGGADIDPALYGAPVTHSRVWNPDLDKIEFELIRLILKHERPLIGVCRGHQLITAVLGGTLHQDIQAELGVSHRHSKVWVKEDSTLASILGKGGLVQANSLHHQSTNVVPDGWEVVAWHDDGVVEAIENRNHPNVVSVQWHPEMIRWQQEKIFDYLLEV